jgi:hypothetical protein
MQSAYHILSSVFGYQEFRPPQGQVIACLCKSNLKFIALAASSTSYALSKIVNISENING